MTHTLIDAMTSLTALMEEESEKLACSPYLADLPEIAAAKIRLAGRIDAEVARLSREQGDWMAALPAEEREALLDVSKALRDASIVNAQVLERQIELSVDMMAAIASEAQRLSGAKSATYGAGGGIKGMDAPAPISINAKL